ncbi:MAG: rhomboid family intramembrane serine protease [Actinobacteria bacterium]|nr:rhomboid family intramembrane serine protease [Actinomycetota bacterium]
MTPSPVGMRCPECASHRTKVIDAHQIVNPRLFDAAPVTTVLIALNLVAFVAELVTGAGLSGFSSRLNGSVLLNGVFYGPAVAAGDWWRIFTCGFLHLGLLHIAMNMALLFILGRQLEPEIGRTRFAAIYFASLAAGSLGSLVLEPTTPAAGASGAIFGLMGAVFVVARARGINPWQSGIGTLIALNLIITFSVGGISKGGHLGGLVGGLVVGWLLIELDERRHLLGRGALPAVGIGVIFTAAFAIATVLLAQSKFPFVG